MCMKPLNPRLVIIDPQFSTEIFNVKRPPPCFGAGKIKIEGFPGGAVVENLPANAGDTGSSPGLGRSHMPRSN